MRFLECKNKKSEERNLGGHISLWSREERGGLWVAQTIKYLPAMQETWVRSLGWEDSLEKEMATRSSIFAWEIPWTEDPGGLPSMGCKESDMNE